MRTHFFGGTYQGNPGFFYTKPVRHPDCVACHGNFLPEIRIRDNCRVCDKQELMVCRYLNGSDLAQHGIRQHDPLILVHNGLQEFISSDQAFHDNISFTCIYKLDSFF